MFVRACSVSACVCLLVHTCFVNVWVLYFAYYVHIQLTYIRTSHVRMCCSVDVSVPICACMSTLCACMHEELGSLCFIYLFTTICKNDDP